MQLWALHPASHHDMRMDRHSVSGETAGQTEKTPAGSHSHLASFWVQRFPCVCVVYCFFCLGCRFIIYKSTVYEPTTRAATGVDDDWWMISSEDRWNQQRLGISMDTHMRLKKDGLEDQVPFGMASYASSFQILSGVLASKVIRPRSQFTIPSLEFLCRRGSWTMSICWRTRPKMSLAQWLGVGLLPALTKTWMGIICIYIEYILFIFIF